MNGNNKHTYEKKFSEYHPYYISKLEHELFIKKHYLYQKQNIYYCQKY